MGAAMSSLRQYQAEAFLLATPGSGGLKTRPAMSTRFPACPHLPASRERMDWRDFSGHGENRGPEFYATALEYGNYLWQRGLAARAILCLDRALGADLQGDEPALVKWPLPYAAMALFLRHTPPDVFIGNPRVHFQHYAGRMNEPRREQRRWRAWACWEITRVVLPHLPGDPKHVIEEPSRDFIAGQLGEHGHRNEVALWRDVLASCEKG
jgi:hypothetical protein